MIKTKDWLLRIPTYERFMPIGMYKRDLVTPYDIVKRGIDVSKVDTIDVRIARERFYQVLDELGKKGINVVSSSGRILSRNNIPKHIEKDIIEVEKNRSIKILRK